MATVSELISLIDAKYPSATTSADKVAFMNLAQSVLSNDYGMLATDDSLETVGFEDEYALPTGIDDIAQIESFEIANIVPDTDCVMTATDMQVGAYTITEQPISPSKISFTHVSNDSTDTLGTIALVGVSGGATVSETITPVADSTVYSTYYYDEITSATGVDWVTDGDADSLSIGVKNARYDTQRYPVGYRNDKPFSARCIYQAYSSAGVKSLIIYPAPVTAGLPISIRYKKPLTALSTTSLAASPEFDSKYHHMLATYACYEIAASGSSPDTIQANRFSAEYDGLVQQLWKDGAIKKINSPKKRKDNRTWYRR